MRIDIMRDIIKSSSLASCDSHSFPSEFRADAGFLGELRRLSNITEDSVQWEQSTFEWGTSPSLLIQISRTARWSAICLQFGKKCAILEGNQRVSEPPVQPPSSDTASYSCPSPQDPTFC